MLDEYAEMKEFVEEQKPYWLNLTGGTTFSGELRYELENHFPEAHYKKAVDRAIREEAEDREGLVPDGGRYTETLYAWYDPDTDTYLTHAEAGSEFATPFFEEEGEARRFLEHRSRELDDTAQYEGLSLQKLKAKKIGEAVEVLTDQAGIEDFVPDGGTEQDVDEVYLWYDPEFNAVIQEEVTPGLYAGVFDQEEEAIYFMDEYREKHDLDDLSRFELHRTTMEKIGSGDTILGPE